MQPVVSILTILLAITIFLFVYSIIAKQDKYGIVKYTHRHTIWLVNKTHVFYI